MDKLQLILAIFALIVVVITIVSTMLAVWKKFDNVDKYLRFTELVLSWPVVASVLVFGGGEAMIRAYHACAGS